MPPIVTEEFCNLCGKCCEICPEDVFVMTESGPAVRRPDECWYCGACAMDCPTSAIKIRIPPSMRVSAQRIK